MQVLNILSLHNFKNFYKKSVTNNRTVYVSFLTDARNLLAVTKYERIREGEGVSHCTSSSLGGCCLASSGQKKR